MHYWPLHFWHIIPSLLRSHTLATGFDSDPLEQDLASAIGLVSDLAPKPGLALLLVPATFGFVTNTCSLRFPDSFNSLLFSLYWFIFWTQKFRGNWVRLRIDSATQVRLSYHGGRHLSVSSVQDWAISGPQPGWSSARIAWHFDPALFCAPNHSKTSYLNVVLLKSNEHITKKSDFSKIPPNCNRGEVLPVCGVDITC